MSRRAIERLKERSGQLFMGSSPDVYMIFAAPSVIERHLRVKHPFFIGAASSKSNGVNFRAWSRGTAGHQPRIRTSKSELKLDPLVDPIAVTPSIKICELSLLEAANRYVYGGSLKIDYALEFERALQSLSDVRGSEKRAAAVEALARFAVEGSLAAKLRETSLLAKHSRIQLGRVARHTADANAAIFLSTVSSSS